MHSILFLSLLLSCTSELSCPVQDGGKIVSVTASVDAAKVSFDQDGKSEWDVSDKITVLCNGKTGVFETKDKGQSVEFTGELEIDKGFSFWGVYPHSACVSGLNDNVTVTLPATQTVKPGSYENIVRIAKSPTTDMFFRNACACLKFSVSQPGITRITLRSDDCSYLSGTVTYEWKDAMPQMKTIENGGDVISIEPEGGEFRTDCLYYAAVLPTISGTYTLTLEKGTSLGSVTKGPYAFKRNKNLFLENLDSDVSWTGKVLSYDFSTSPNWDLCKTAVPQNVTYSVKENGGDHYDFIYNNCYSANKNSGSVGYLVISTGYLGLPILKGYRLSAVEMTLGNHNTKRYISVNSDEYAKAIVTDGGVQTEVAAASLGVRFELPNSMEGQRYWLYSKSTFVMGHLKLWYEPATVKMEDVDKVIGRAIADGTVPGAVLGVWKDGNLVYEKAYGNKSVTPSVVPMTSDVVFDMASCTKVMSTTIAVMQLYEQGKISLDEKVSYYLNEFLQDDPITVMDLLTHVSGLVRVTTDYKLYAGNPKDFVAQTAIAARASQPGEKYKYDCINFIMLQQIVERISGKRICDYAKENIYVPLGMDDTMYLPVNEGIDPAYKSRIAPKTSKTSDIGIVYDSMARVVFEGNAGNAGVFSTVEDVLRFGRAILAGGILDGKRVLEESTIETMSTVIDPAIGRTPGWDCLSITGFKKGTTVSRNTIFHSGYCGCMVLVDRENNLCIALLANRTHPQNTGYDAWDRYRGLICDIIGACLCR